MFSSDVNDSKRTRLQLKLQGQVFRLQDQDIDFYANVLALKG